MDHNNIFVLLIQRNPAEVALIRRSLARHGEGVFKLQCVESLSTALARIGGGGVDVIMLDLSLPHDRSGDGMAAFLQVRQAAPGVPVIVLYDPADEGLALKAMRAGAADYLLNERTSENISAVIRSALELGQIHPGPRNPLGASRNSAGILSFMGAKGGVGTTTVALNVAAVLARRCRVILVEMQPAFGSLLAYLRPYGQIRNTASLMRADAPEMGAAEAAASLWPCKNVPGLSILFGPHLAADCGELDANRVKTALAVLAALADYLILDLPPSLAGSNRAASASSGRLILVMERDPVCLSSATLMARAVESWVGTPQPLQTVVVNRASVSCPIPLAEIEAQLGFPALGVVAPGPDLCLAAQHAHVPLVLFQPESLIAGSLVDIAGKCSSFMTTAHMVA